MKHPEQQLHKAVAAYLRVALKPPTIWTTFPSGGGGKVRGAQLKAMGLQAGWPDILVISQSESVTHATCVVGIELKSLKGRASEMQMAVRHDFITCRAHYYICRSVDEVEGFLRGVGIPLHASVGTKGTAIRIERAE